MIKIGFTSGVLGSTTISWTPSFETKAIVSGATETINYYFANKEIVARKNNDGSIHYYHSDHLGSVSVLTNQSGAVVESTKYDPWGLIKTGGTQTKHGYTGQEFDSESGLNYYKARYYGSNFHRFAQPDPIIQNIYDPQSLNRYSYTRNNPLKYTDPTGHFFGSIISIFNVISAFTSKPAQKSNSSNDNIINKLSAPPSSIPGMSKIANQPLDTNTGNNLGLSSKSNSGTGVSVAGVSGKDQSILGSNNMSSKSSSNLYTYDYSQLPDKGYLNLGVSGGFGLGITGGALVNRHGYRLYWGVGYTTPGIFPSVTYSASDPTSGQSMSYSASAIVAGSYNTPFYKEAVSFKEFFQDGTSEVGFSLPGISAMSVQTFEHNSWD